MVDYTIVNGTAATISNVNAGGTDISAYTFRNGVTLTNTELAAYLTNGTVAAFPDLTSSDAAAQIKRVLGVASKYPNTAA